MKYLLVICLCIYGVFAKHEKYDGHAVYEIDVNSVDQAKLVYDFEIEMFLDVLSQAVPGHPGQVLVPKIKKEIFENFLNQAGVHYRVKVENIKQQLELEDKLLASAAAKSNSTKSRLSFDKIYTYEEVNDYMEELAKEFSDVVTVVEGGKSIEGRAIKYLKISSTNFQDASKKVVMVQSLIHAREWVTLPVTLYAIHKLVIDVTEADLIQNIDWIILPIANPDGYVFSHNVERFWRKNRATNYFIGSLCAGVDLNRNFDSNWGTESSSFPCSDVFHGGRAFSEPESAVIRDILAEHRDRMALYLDIHSFGSMILYGHGNGTLPPHALQLHLIGVQMAQAVDRVKWPSNRDYIVGNIMHVLSAASGGASDYAMAAATPWSYVYELPVYQNPENFGEFDGFLVDPDFIEQAGFETWEGIKVGVRATANLFMKSKF